MSRETRLRFGADTSGLDAAFAQMTDELAGFAAAVEAISQSIAETSARYRQQDAGDDAAYWQNLIAEAESAAAMRAELDQASLAQHRSTAREWQEIDNEAGRDFSDVAMAAITGRQGGVQAALADVVRRALAQALAGIGSSLMRELTTGLGLTSVSPSSLLGSLFGSGGTDVGTAAMQQLDQTLQGMGLATESLDVTTAANTLATSANTAAESAGGAAGGAGLLGLLGFAGGGRPPIGMPSIVGERGPELFLPDSAGTVIPNGSWNHATGGDFAPSISMPVSFHGGTPSMSKAEFRRMLGGNVDYLLGELKNLHRNAGRRVPA